MPRTYRWINPPPRWSGDAASLAITTGAKTDFWRHTFYGFERHSGHAYVAPVTGDFTASAEVTGDYEALYDQAGLFLAADERTWIKAGIEFTDGLMHFSVVVTREVSDWSVVPLPQASPKEPVAVRLTRHGDAVRVQYSVAGSAWQMARLCPFPASAAEIGVMACSPERDGFEVRFHALTIGPPIARKLHDD